MGSPSQRSEHLQITQPDGATALASRSKDQRSTAPKDESAASAGARYLLLAVYCHEPSQCPRMYAIGVWVQARNDRSQAFLTLCM